MRTIKKGKTILEKQSNEKRWHVNTPNTPVANLFANEDNGYNSCVALIPFY